MLGASLLYAIAESLGFISVIGQSDVSFRAYRAALRANDAAGMTFAIEGLDRAFERASSARTLAGARSARFQDERTVSEERAVQNESLRSSLEDLDVADAATRLSSLSTQLQAGLLAIGRTSTLSLLDFLR